MSEDGASDPACATRRQFVTGDWFDGDVAPRPSSEPEESTTDDRHVTNNERPGRSLFQVLRRVVTPGPVASE